MHDQLGEELTALGLHRTGEENDLAILAVLDVLHEIGDGDLLRTGDLVEPPREQDGDEDYRHPIDDQGSQGAVHRTSVRRGLS